MINIPKATIIVTGDFNCNIEPFNFLKVLNDPQQHTFVRKNRSSVTDWT
jgi:hypothetical protein